MQVPPLDSQQRKYLLRVSGFMFLEGLAVGSSIVLAYSVHSGAHVSDFCVVLSLISIAAGFLAHPRTSVELMSVSLLSVGMLLLVTWVVGGWVVRAAFDAQLAGRTHLLFRDTGLLGLALVAVGALLCLVQSARKRSQSRASSYDVSR